MTSHFRTLAAALLVLSTAACDEVRDAQTSGDPCIAGVVLDLAGRSEGQKIDIRSQFVGSVRRDPTNSLAGVAVRSDHVYFQFRNHCDRKEAVVDDLLAQMVKANATFPKYSRINTPISPSPATIDLGGVSTPR